MNLTHLTDFDTCNAIGLIQLREEAIPELSKLLKKYSSSLTGYQEDASLKLLQIRKLKEMEIILKKGS